MTYAFRVFAAIFNHRVVDSGKEESEIQLIYAEKPPWGSRSGCFHIPALYRAKPWKGRLPELVKYRYSDEEMYLLHGLDSAAGKPDWLGEVFEWISSSYESGEERRDRIGRIPSREIFNTLGIPPRKPHAALLMAWLENALENGNNKEALPKAPSPIPGVEHIVICSQDIDFYHVDKSSAASRLIKNMAIALRPHRSWSFLRSNSRMFVDLLRGRKVGDFLPSLLERMERQGLRSTAFVVSRQGHRRDPNYRLEELKPRVIEILKRGFSAELHGSYTSIVENAGLNSELAAVEKAIGRKPQGNRQHWLRFDEHKKLFDAIEKAGLLFDSTLGFTETVGFRNGASFAFPPYDFERERPYQFLEVPLALMDVGLETESRAHGKDPQSLADEVLRESRKRGWGGISVLWHNPIEALHVPKEINEVFWNSAPKPQSGETWMSAEQFLSRCLGRYQNAGLMDKIGLEAVDQARRLP